tara:strand:- start:2194 stop:3324 length:1131 start_codon:yes stop_codon:yes gene_type:complete
VNFIPYAKQTISDDDIQSVETILKSPYITSGPMVEEFEAAMASYCGAKYCLAVANGTAALHLSSLVLLKEEDTVLTTPNSFLATSNSILYAKAKPKFVDIDVHGNIDLDLCEEEIKHDPSIKAIYAVAFSGRMINQKKLAYLRDKYNILVLEDCSHAIGSVDDDDVKAGSCKNSEISTFSFHPVKHITAGEGGAITTNNKSLYNKLKMLRSHGMYKDSTMKPWEYEMRDLGFNYRITDIQCSLALSQLKKLDSFIVRRYEIAKKYDKEFSNTIIRPLYPYLMANSSYHLYIVRVDFKSIKINKDELFRNLREQNIGLQLHYIPINTQPYYRSLGYGNEYIPMMNKYYKECFSLPMYPLLSDEEQKYTIAALKENLN